MQCRAVPVVDLADPPASVVHGLGIELILILPF
jgi:hypothetical protein